MNCFLSEFNYFLRVFELKNKFGHFTTEEPKKQNIVRQISICITKKYNKFQAISIEFSRKERKKYKPIDIIYKPTKNPELSLLRYFTQDISKAYHNFYSVGDKTESGFGSYECYYCRKFFLREDRHKRHVEKCAGIPDIVYNFNTKNLITFQDSFNAKGDLPFVMYFDFETTFEFDKKIKSQNLEIDVFSKMQYERKIQLIGKTINALYVKCL